jgi:uncharacterized protein (UPF0333 family)
MPSTIQLYISAVVLLIIVALGGTTYYYHSKYEAEVTKNALQTTKNNDLSNAIKADNLIIEKLQIDSLTREAAAKKAIADIQKQVDEYNKQAQIYLANEPTNKNLCISANYILTSYLQGAK